MADNVLLVGGGCHLQLDPAAVVVGAEGPEMGLLHTLDTLQLPNLNGGKNNLDSENTCFF